MEKNEIKKAYQKMSKQLKKAGFNYTCVMNARQQELGTATICFGIVKDYEAEIARAKASLEDTEAIEKELRHDMRERTRLMPTWREWAKENGSNAQFWKDRVAEWDAGTYEGRRRQEIIDRIERWLKAAQESFEKAGTLKEQYEKARERYEALSTAAPVVEFLKMVNGTAHLEYKNEHGAEYCYLRFWY